MFNVSISASLKKIFQQMVKKEIGQKSKEMILKGNVEKQRFQCMVTSYVYIKKKKCQSAGWWMK